MSVASVIVRFLRNFLIITIPACLVLWGFLELFFRSAVPASDRPYAVYDPTWKLLKYETTRGTRGLYTAGQLGQLRVRWRVNNDGWNSDIDYRAPRSDKPRIAIIGDSFVEAFQVAPKDNFAAVLRRQLGDDHEVYAFGFSGSPLSHYLQMARYVNAGYDPDVLVFNVVQNDFHQSLCEVRRPPGMLCYAEQDGRWDEGDVIPFVPNPIKRFSRRSALVRYWYHNLGGRIDLPYLTREFDTNKQKYLMGGDPQEVMRLREKIDAVVGIIIQTMKAEAQDRRVLVMLTTVGHPAPVDDLTQTQNWWMHELLARRCAEHGVEFIDLDPIFKTHYEAHHQRFESPYDSHWNEVGHHVVGETLWRALTNSGTHLVTRHTHDHRPSS